jgi:hypothetical protein
VWKVGEKVEKLERWKVVGLDLQMVLQMADSKAVLSVRQKADYWDEHQVVSLVRQKVVHWGWLLVDSKDLRKAVKMARKRVERRVLLMVYLKVELLVVLLGKW